MHFILYRKHEDGFWHPIRRYENRQALIHDCLLDAETVFRETAMNDNDKKNIVVWLSDGEYRNAKTDRRLLFMDEDGRIIDPRPWIRTEDWDSTDLFNIMCPRRRPYWNPKHQWRHRHRGGGFRKVRHYKDCLKDDYYYRDEADGYDITKPHVVEDPWVTEPGRNVPAAGRIRQDTDISTKNTLISIRVINITL